MSLLNVGARALLANQVVLQTTGHNIANVSVAGYSRQNVALETVQGQFTGGGYIGKGVAVATILRNHDELLTRQAAAAQAVQVSDAARADRLTQMQDIFTGGTSGLGAAITDMMNSLGDVIAAPTDITARTVTLTRMDEMAARMRSASQQLQELDYAVKEQLGNNVTTINTLAQNIADVNEQIARTKGNGHTPNDLLDKRDQLIREMNQYIQTTQIPADDGTVGVFIGASQALVLGTTAAQVSIDESPLFPGSQQMALFFNRPGAAPVEMNEGMLGGGQVAGLLKFANQDLAESRNLLGRMAVAIGSTLNYQQQMGLTLDGVQGRPLFSTPATVNGLTSGSAVGTIDFTNPSLYTPSEFAASDYEVRFTTPPAGQVVRLSDGKTTAFTSLANLASQQIDGLTFNLTAAGAANERVLFKPFANAAANIQALVHSPRDLAAANPVNAQMGTQNTGTLQLAGLQATGQHWNPGPPAQVQNTGTINLPPSPVPPATTGGGVTLTFGAGGTFTVAGTATVPLDMSVDPPVQMTPPYQYTPGQAISIDGWQITLQGTPNAGDTVTVGNVLDAQYGDIYTRNAGNATALMNLRDAQLFDNSTLSDGYAGLMARVGTRTQSAQYAAKLSDTIAANLEADRTAVSGVNLDEEAAKLIQFQQAYQASAKLLQVAQTIFDNLLQTMSR